MFRKGKHLLVILPILLILFIYRLDISIFFTRFTVLYLLTLAVTIYSKFGLKEIPKFLLGTSIHRKHFFSYTILTALIFLSIRSIRIFANVYSEGVRDNIPAITDSITLITVAGTLLLISGSRTPEPTNTASIDPLLSNGPTTTPS